MPTKWWTDADTPEGDVVPDIGFYLADSWVRTAPMTMTAPIEIPGLDKPINRVLHYDWPDGGVPPNQEHFTTVLKWLVTEIESGMVVDVGCIGSHGRTGTTLACICILMGMRPGEAIRHVRKVHCKEAIENSNQVDFVVSFADKERGYDPDDSEDAADNDIVNAERKNCYKESLWKTVPATPTAAKAADGATYPDPKVEDGGPDSWATIVDGYWKGLEADGLLGSKPLACCGHEEALHDCNQELTVWWCDEYLPDKGTYCGCTEPATADGSLLAEIDTYLKEGGD
jgi:hypothetical protein